MLSEKPATALDEGFWMPGTLPPVPVNEQERLNALLRFQILDTHQEQDFDDIAALASHVCQTPIALITFVDANRQWFKSRVGIQETETPRDIAFCAHAITQDGLFLIEDAVSDPRFAENPLVKEDPHIRFYCGAPLVTKDKFSLGTLCVIDRVPRQLNDDQKQALLSLSRQAVRQLELRHIQNVLSQTIDESRAKEEALRISEQMNTRMVEASMDCIKVLDLEGRLLSMNSGGQKILEIPDFGPLMNCPWVEFWHGRDKENASSAIQTALQGSVGRFVGYCPSWEGKPMWWDVVVNPILDANGKPELLLAVSRDVTKSRMTEEQFRTLFETAPIGIAINQPNGRFVRVNRTFQEMLGYSEEELCRVTFKNITLGEDLAESLRLFGELVSGVRNEFQVEKRYTKKNGEVIWANTRCASVRDDDGNFLFTFAMVEDITDRKKALFELQSLKNKLQIENTYLQEEIKIQHNSQEIIGVSQAVKKVFQSIDRVAPTDSTVLITGETGTGKELVARAIHDCSTRKERALIIVNCAALPSGLIESELFGHEKGAFTGAITRKKGKFELADGGSIFLDEVGELPIETQIKLLRVLQEQEFERVGGTQTLSVDVRVIAATNRNLQEQARTGAFRNDLFYRLNIFPVALPPLRERTEDIPFLVSHFVSKFSRRMAKKIDRISAAAEEMLRSYTWPGNVRELANVLERAVILCDGGELQIEQLGISLSQSLSETIPKLQDFERAHILEALEKTNWIVGGPTGAAKLLGLNRTTLLARMKKLGIERPL